MLIRIKEILNQKSSKNNKKKKFKNKYYDYNFRMLL